MREMWSVVTRWQHVGRDAVALPALGIFTCWMVSCMECTLFEIKRCTLFENNVFIWIFLRISTYLWIQL